MTEELKLSTMRDGALRFEVHARPRARASAVTAVRGGALVVRIAAPPVDGAANEELVATLAAALGVPKRDIAIVGGQASRRKIVEVRGLSAMDALKRLEPEKETRGAS